MADEKTIDLAFDENGDLAVVGGGTYCNTPEPVFAPKPKKVRGDDLEGLGIGLSGMVEEMGPHGIGVRSSGRSY